MHIHLSVERTYAQSLAAVSAVALLSVLVYALAWILYTLCFHPLAKFPGPKLAATTRVVHTKRCLSGEINPWLKELHNRYGEVVRVAPNELSFISGETAWQDIYGFHVGRAHTGRHWEKDLKFFLQHDNKTWSLLQQTHEAHSRQRRLLAHAFSDKALREQEPILQGYVQKFMSNLAVAAKDGELLNFTDQYNLFTFDIIGDLTFAESFGCLDIKGYHPWVKKVFETMRAMTTTAAIQHYPWLSAIGEYITPPSIVKARQDWFGFVQKRVQNRLNSEVARPDFLGFTMKHTDAEKGVYMSRNEMDSNASLLLVAGSETTATLLAGATALLLQNPEKLARLVREVRGLFTNANEITIDACFKLRYLIAVLQEALRYYPPVSSGFGRVAPPGGGHVSGHFVPAGVVVSVPQVTTNRSSRNFSEPESFIPERWLEDERPEHCENDKLDVVNPFSFGPRNCLGKNLAHAEMRVLLARLVFEFDIEGVDGQGMQWFEQKTFMFWDKPPLMVKCVPATMKA